MESGRHLKRKGLMAEVSSVMEMQIVPEGKGSLIITVKVLKSNRELD